MECNRDSSFAAEFNSHIYTNADNVRFESLIQPADLTPVEPVFDAEISHSQLELFNDRETPKVDDYHTSPSTALPVQHGATGDDFLFPFLPDEDFADLFTSSMSAEPPCGSWPNHTATTSPNMINNSPLTTSPSDREFCTDGGTPYSSEPDYPPKPLHSSNIHPGLPRRRSRYFMPKSTDKDSVSNNINTIELDPMQRWQENSPENEPASVTAIMNAMQETPAVNRTRQPGRGRGRGCVSSGSRRSASATSRGSSVSSTDSAWSSTSYSSRTRNRRSHTRLSKPRSDTGKPRIFCCTFCCDRFGTRYEWVRHEKSLHLNLEAWYCAPLGPSVLSLVTGKEYCAYCNETKPSQEHLLMHNYDTCQNLDNEHRSFRRKDHLVQHLRHVHHVQELPLLDDWKREVKDFRSRCGFCDQALDDWDSRVSHLSQHFRKGLTMKDWKGDHGFPPHITAQLRNAYPPYLLGWESDCMIPFSATNADVGNQYAHLMSGTDLADVHEQTKHAHTDLAGDDESTPQLPQFLDIFTRHLSQYARRQMDLGVMPTDEMFQKEARKVLFDSEDAWDQTIADNADWLSAFRRVHMQPTEHSADIP